jgi:hypothetical protein
MTMFTHLGVALLAVSVILYAWAFGQTRRPDAPKWAKSQLFASGVCLTIVALAPIGAGFVAAGLFQGPFSVWDMGGLVEAAVLTFALWLVVPRLVRVRMS